jgi:hypothetical protein
MMARFGLYCGFGQSLGAKIGKESQPKPKARLCRRFK